MEKIDLIKKEGVSYGINSAVDNRLSVKPAFGITQLIQHGNVGGSANPSPYDVTPNSWKLFKWAVANSFKFIETDIRATSDGVLVLCHNETINDSATNIDGSAISNLVYVASSTYDDLLNYRFGGDNIVTLEEFLRFCKRYNVGCHLECKISMTDYASYIVTLLQKTGMVDNVYIEPHTPSEINIFAQYDIDKSLRYQITSSQQDISTKWELYKDNVKQIIFNLVPSSMDDVNTIYTDECHLKKCIAKVNLTSLMNIANQKLAVSAGFDLVLSNTTLPQEITDL